MRFVIEVEIQNDGGLRPAVVAEHIAEALYRWPTLFVHRVLAEVKDVQWLP